MEKTDKYCAGMNSVGCCPMRLSCARYSLNLPLEKRKEMHLFERAPYETERTYCKYYQVITR